MFAHTRNLFWWQKLHSVTEWQRQDKTQIIKNNIQIYKIDNVQNSTNTIYKIDNLVCTMFMRWIAWGKKLFLCLAVLVLRALWRRPDGNSSKRECAGCEGSRVILPALLLTLDEYSSWRVGRVVPMIRSAVRTTLCSLLRSDLVAHRDCNILYQFLWRYVHSYQDSFNLQQRQTVVHCKTQDSSVRPKKMLTGSGTKSCINRPNTHWKRKSEWQRGIILVS